jgi:hypothetical protein
MLSSVYPPVPQSDAEQLEAVTNEAVAACDGDVRAALKAMIVANAYLESELSALQTAVSKGYARGQWQAAPRDKDWYD